MATSNCLPAREGVAALADLFVSRGPPAHIRSDNGSEFIASAVQEWLGRIGVNVNQIAHWANANEHITAEQVAELRASFDRIEQLLGDLFADKREARKDA